MPRHIRTILILVAAVVAAAVMAAPAQAQSWPAVFEPSQVLTFNLDMDQDDWETIRDDETNEIEVPAQFWADGEAPMLVSVRRKSSVAVGDKVGLKIDINEFVDGQKWHGLVKLSLENGDEDGPIAEGLAWNLHEMASIAGFYGAGYHAALANWARVNLNGEYLGLYSNVEQRDTQFLRNRGIYTKGSTWFYEISDLSGFELETGDPHSPTWDALCFEPFFSGTGNSSPCPTPPDAAERMSELIDMQAMLTQGAVDAVTGNSDALFTNGKNFFHVDFADGRKRLYYPWDLDAVFGGNAGSIYPNGGDTGYQTILSRPGFRSQYNSLILGLTDPNGPLSEANIQAFLDTVEPQLSQALAEDPNADFDPEDVFESLRRKVSERIAKVRAEAAADAA
jgi:spore coat protein CotH